MPVSTRAHGTTVDPGPSGTARREVSRTGRVAAVAYAVVAYVAFLGVVLYAIAFLADTAVPRTVDEGGPTGGTATAVVVDAALLGLFAVQHSVMARPWFKRRWTRIVPATVERSTFVLLASAVLALLFWQWRPIDDVVWDVDGPAAVALWVGFGTGWFLVVFSTFLINHFELFGLRQVYLHARGRDVPAPEFRTPLLYRVVRHPIMVGFLIAFWSTPTMTTGHLLFAGLASGYILVAVRFEEHDLAHQLPAYRDYMRTTPRFLPRPGGTGQRTVGARH